MPSQFIGVRLNPAVPRDRAILAYLQGVAARQRSAKVRDLLFLGLHRAEPAHPGAEPAPKATREEQRQAWVAPAEGNLKLAAQFIGLLSAGEFELFTTVAWHPYLSVADAAAWTGYAESFVRATLNFLERAGGLRSASRWVAPWPRATYYALTEFGVMGLAVHQQQPLGETKRALNFGTVQLGFFVHTVEANRFFLALHAQQKAGQLERWDAEAASRVTFPYAGRKRRGVLRPDGYGEWRADGWRYAFYLEWDRHDGNPRKLKEKLRLYLDYYAYLQQTPEPTLVLPTLLFVANDANRVRLVWKCLKQLLTIMPYRQLLLRVTYREQIWTQGPLASIWTSSPDSALTGPWDDQTL